jgi:hypothetical protein
MYSMSTPPTSGDAGRSDVGYRGPTRSPLTRNAGSAVMRASRISVSAVRVKQLRRTTNTLEGKGFGRVCAAPILLGGVSRELSFVDEICNAYSDGLAAGLGNDQGSPARLGVSPTRGTRTGIRPWPARHAGSPTNALARGRGRTGHEPPDPAHEYSDEVRDRRNDALVLIKQILGANPYGAPIADQVTTRIHLLLAERYVEAAFWALAKLML